MEVYLAAKVQYRIQFFPQDVRILGRAFRVIIHIFVGTSAIRPNSDTDRQPTLDSAAVRIPQRLFRDIPRTLRLTEMIILLIVHPSLVHGTPYFPICAYRSVVCRIAEDELLVILQYGERGGHQIGIGTFRKRKGQFHITHFNRYIIDRIRLNPANCRTVHYLYIYRLLPFSFRQRERDHGCLRIRPYGPLHGR